MKLCKNCGYKDFDDDAVFCRECGAKLVFPFSASDKESDDIQKEQHAEKNETTNIKNGNISKEFFLSKFNNIDKDVLFNANEKQLNNIRLSCNIPNEEEIFAIIDCTVFHSAKDGVAFTGNGIYGKEQFKNPIFLPWRYFSLPKVSIDISLMSVNIICQGIKFHFDTSGASMSCFTLQKVFQKIYETLRSEIRNTEQSSNLSSKASSEYKTIENNNKTKTENNNKVTNKKSVTSPPQEKSFTFLGYEILVSRNEEISGTESLLISFLGYTRGILCDNTIDLNKYLIDRVDYSELSEEEKISISIQSFITLVFTLVDNIEEKNMPEWAKKMSHPRILYYLCIFLYLIFLSNQRNKYCKIIYKYILIPYTEYAYKLINELHKDEFMSSNKDPEELLDYVINRFSPMNLKVDPTREDADEFNDFSHQIQLEDIKNTISEILRYNVEKRIARELVDDYVDNYVLSMDESFVADLDEEIFYGFSNEIDEIISIMLEELTRGYTGPKELENQLKQNLLKRGLR